MTSNQRVPLGQVSNVTTEMAILKIKRRNQFRTVTVSASRSRVSAVGSPYAADAEDRGVREEAASGIFLEIGGEHDEQVKGFGSSPW